MDLTSNQAISMTMSSTDTVDKITEDKNHSQCNSCNDETNLALELDITCENCEDSCINYMDQEFIFNILQHKMLTIIKIPPTVL